MISMPSTLNRSGLSRIDVLASCVCIFLLSSISISALQRIRETSRDSTCLERLTRFSEAAHNYHDANDRLPAGTLGSARTPQLQKWDSNSWKDHQLTSCLALMLPFLEMQDQYKRVNLSAYDFRRDLSEKIDRNRERLYNWFGEIEGLPAGYDLKDANIFLCPADNGIQDENLEYMLSVHPVIPLSMEKGDNQVDQMWTLSLKELATRVELPPSWKENLALSPANYLGCAGAHSGGIHPNNEFQLFAGCMSTRGKVSLLVIANQDGTAKTLMFGETIGGITRGKRNSVQTCFTGGLARGLGLVPWGEKPSTEKPLLGNSKFASVYGFGSMHENHVNFVFCDGSTKKISRDIDHLVFKSFCGRKDREIDLQPPPKNEVKPKFECPTCIVNQQKLRQLELRILELEKRLRSKR